VVVNFDTAPVSPADELARILPHSRPPSPTLAPPPPRSAPNTTPPPLPVRGHRSPAYDSTVSPTFRPPTRIQLSSTVPPLPPDFRPIHATVLYPVPSRSSTLARLNSPHDTHADVHNEPSYNNTRHRAHDNVFDDTPTAIYSDAFNLPLEAGRNNTRDNDDNVVDVDDLVPHDERVQTPVSVIDGTLWPDVTSADHSLQTQVCEEPGLRSTASRRREDPPTLSDGPGLYHFPPRSTLTTTNGFRAGTDFPTRSAASVARFGRLPSVRWARVTLGVKCFRVVRGEQEVRRAVRPHR
jgi:hypothetical protein